jgi:hypothetical protein
VNLILVICTCKIAGQISNAKFACEEERKKNNKMFIKQNINGNNNNSIETE